MTVLRELCMKCNLEYFITEEKKDNYSASKKDLQLICAMESMMINLAEAWGAKTRSASSWWLGCEAAHTSPGT